jgi:hypothetical protein
MTDYKWVCVLRTILGGKEYALGDLWSGVGASPATNRAAWAPVAVGTSVPVAPAPVLPEEPAEPRPYFDNSSAESLARSMAELEAWRKRGNK